MHKLVFIIFCCGSMAWKVMVYSLKKTGQCFQVIPAYGEIAKNLFIVCSSLASHADVLRPGFVTRSWAGTRDEHLRTSAWEASSSLEK